jgi:hypothetical protein
MVACPAQLKRASRHPLRVVAEQAAEEQFGKLPPLSPDPRRVAVNYFLLLVAGTGVTTKSSNSTGKPLPSGAAHTSPI